MTDRAAELLDDRVATLRVAGGNAETRGHGVDRWPAAVPGQIHHTVDDPFRNQAGIDAVLAKAREADANVAMFEY